MRGAPQSGFARRIMIFSVSRAPMPQALMLAALLASNIYGDHESEI